ncbi:MAG: ribonuclease E/G, partial [Gallionella sp.]
RYDRARVQTAKISRFGLLELSRQRLAPSLGEGNYMPCPRCSGIGHIRGIESSALHILRIIQEEAMKESSAAIHVQVPVDVATFLLNEKRADIFRIESRLKVGVTLIPNPHMETPNYSINRLRQDDMTSEVLQASYKLVEKPAEEKPLGAAQEQQKAIRAQAVVQGVTPIKAAPVQEQAAQPSMLGRFFAWFKSFGEEEQPQTRTAPGRQRSAQRPERAERGERAEGNGGKRRGRGERGDRGERSEAAAGNRNRNEPRNGQKPAEAKTQEQRQPRPPRPQRAAGEGAAKGMPGAAPANRTGEEKPVLESQVAALEQTEAATPPREGGRRRGRRGGRKEREHREAAAANGEAQQSMEPVDTAPAGPTEYIAYPDGFVRPSEYIAMPTVYTPSVPAELAPTLPAVVEANLPAAVPPARVATRPQVAAPAPTSTPAPAAASGLIQIETDPIKLETMPEFAGASAGASERHAPRRRPRQREVYVENEPLVQIETQHTQQG